MSKKINWDKPIIEKALVIDGEVYIRDPAESTKFFNCWVHKGLPYTDEEGRKRSGVKTECLPRNFIGRFLDWLDDMECFHPIALNGSIFAFVGIITAFMFWFSANLIAEGFDFDVPTVICFGLTIVYLAASILYGKEFVVEVYDAISFKRDQRKWDAAAAARDETKAYYSKLEKMKKEMGEEMDEGKTPSPSDDSIAVVRIVFT